MKKKPGPWKMLGAAALLSLVIVWVAVGLALGFVIGPLIWGFRAASDKVDDLLSNSPDRLRRWRDGAER